MAGPRVPNLFLIGAPKCGTTAMSHYLAGHPDIFMSEQAGVKEPRFFCSDRWYSRDRQITSWQEYLGIFAAAPATAQYLGEATPRYLQSNRAVPEILARCPDPRFIVMLRDPVELATSQHNQRVKSGKEDLDFEAAWKLQEERIRGRSLPAGVDDGRLLQYGYHGLLGKQMQRLLRRVCRKYVHWIFYGDFKQNPKRSYRQLLNFLELPDDGRTQFSRRNSSVMYRSWWLENGLKKVRCSRKRYGLPGGLGINALIDRFNKVPGKASLRPEFKRELQEYFREDVNLLGELTGRDLSSWLGR